jgi:hypothetical protein
LTPSFPWAAGGAAAMVTSLLTMLGSLIFAKLPALFAKPPRAVADAASPTLLSKTLSLDSFSAVIK